MTDIANPNSQCPLTIRVIVYQSFFSFFHSLSFTSMSPKILTRLVKPYSNTEGELGGLYTPYAIARFFARSLYFHFTHTRYIWVKVKSGSTRKRCKKRTLFQTATLPLYITLWVELCIDLIMALNVSIKITRILEIASGIFRILQIYRVFQTTRAAKFSFRSVGSKRG